MTSLLYAAVARQRAALLRGERQAAGEMVRVYGGIWQRVQDGLGGLWELKRQAEAAGVEVDANWLLSQGRLLELQRQVEAELRLFAEFADPLISRQQGAAVDAALSDARELTRLAASPVSVRWVILPADVIEDLIGFTSSGSPLRALFEQFGPVAAEKLKDGLIQGIALGQHPTEIAAAIRQDLGGNLSRALTISRTEALRSYREATRRSYEANDDIVTGWIWHCVCTSRSCAMCWAMHGTVHALNETLDDHPNGRCVMIPQVRTLPGQEQQALSPVGVEQFAKLSAEQQDAILGKAGGAAYRAGKFKLPDVVGRTFDPAWGPMRRTKSLREILT